MTKERARKHKETAKKLRGNSEFAEAGDYYTVAGYEYLGGDIPGFPATDVSHAEFLLLLASVCYRLAGLTGRCRNRCKQGILIAEDMNSRHLPVPEDEYWYERARRGVWYEFIGDFRMVGELGGSQDAYEKAKQIYRQGKNPETGSAERENMELIYFYKQVASPEESVKDWDEIELRFSFTEWVDFKADSLQAELEELDKVKEWPP